MAVFGANGEKLFEGCTLADREENHYDDSDFYAVVWNEETQRCERIDYGSTRFPSPRSCVVDATEEVKQKARNWTRQWYFDRLLNKAESASKDPTMGKMVKVVSGRKIPIGTVGKVVVFQEKVYSPRFRNGYKQGPDAIKIGLALSDRVENVWQIVARGNDLEVVSPYNEGFAYWARSNGGKWNKIDKCWVFSSFDGDLREHLEKSLDAFYSPKYLDIAWTYAKNVEVINSEQYIDRDLLWSQSQVAADGDQFHVPFVRLGAMI